MDNELNNREIAIRLSGVKKRYKLGQIGGGTLQGDLQSWWARVRGKEDPNTKIGTDQRLIGQTFALHVIKQAVHGLRGGGCILPHLRLTVKEQPLNQFGSFVRLRANFQ